MHNVVHMSRKSWFLLSFEQLVRQASRNLMHGTMSLKYKGSTYGRKKALGWENVEA